MQFFIDSFALQRLVDPDLKIRKRALEEIKSVLINNIFFEAQRRSNPLAENELSVVNLAELTKQLIRWFQYEPITDQNEVFDLLIMIFSRRDFLRHITQTISIQRLKKEVVKIKKRLIPKESASRLERIDGLLASFENELLIDVGHDIESFIDVNTQQEPKKNEENILERFNKLQMSTSSTSSKCEGDEEVFHEYWINLEDGDLEIFNSIDSKLMAFEDPQELSNVIKFVQATILDFPPEFYLQPPNILETLIDILPKVSNGHATNIIRIIGFIINGLKCRDMDARKNNVSYIPVKKHMNKILQMLANFFERFHDNFDAASIYRQQEIINAIHLVLLDLAEYIKDTRNACDIYLNELLNMIAKVAMDFRIAYQNIKDNAMIYRLNYIIELNIINTLISVIDVEHIIKYSSNNAWEYECDLALLDWPLRTHNQIYNAIMRNRNSIIEDDNDMKMLLYDIKKSWKTLTNMFKKWDTMLDEDKILNGLKCLDTLRIHKSTELVEVLFEAIEKCSKTFHTNETIKNAAEKIVMRLLSVEIPEIRVKVYQLLRDNVQKKLSEDQEEKLKEMDLCYVIGVPITVEIVTEILCFGYTDANENIHKHAKLILFTILRAKIVFPNHWIQLLEVIKPILPLLAGLFMNDHKLGFFAFDVFHEHSGFDKHELCLAFIRFLFCSHSKARELAKIKLIENLFENDEQTSDFIEIVPENFCILPHEQVKDLELLNRHIGFDNEAYQNIRSVLQSNKHHDVDVIKTVLVQLNSLMNSLKFAQKSHDEHLWIYFMVTLDMGFPKDSNIRRLVINILYKWAIAVSSFRIYLANELSVLKFLIQSLIYCQDDFAIKKLASTLLFLLAFSDFVVITESTVSLPQFIKTLECPFKFQEHWDRSPFNEVSQLEILYEAVKDKNEHVDVKETTMKFLRFTFAEVWFGNSKTIFNEKISKERYYKDCEKKVLKLPQDLMLTEEDRKILNDTSFDTLIKSACQKLQSVKTLGDVHRAVQTTIALFMIPNETVWKIAETLENVIRKFSEYAEKRGESQKEVLVECLELYGNITPFLSDKTIADTFGRKTFFDVFNKSILFPEDDVYMQILQLMNSVVNMCKSRPNLSEMLIFSFNINHKLHFSSHLIEKLYDHLTNVVLKDKSWIDISRVPFVRAIFTLMNNTLRSMPILLDEKYMNTVFRKLMNATRIFLKSMRKEKSNHMNSHILNQIIATIETLTSLNYKYKLTHEEYTIIFLWLTENVKSNKALLWSIISNLTSKKDSFNEFCKGYEASMNFTLNDTFFNAVMNVNSNQIYLHKALSLVMGNLIDHSKESTLDINENRSRSNYINLTKAFLKNKSICADAIGYVLKKTFHNNIQQMNDIVKERKLIEQFLQDTNNLSVVITCYENPQLKEHTCRIVSSINEEHLVKLISCLQHSVYDSTKLSSAKNLNYCLLNIILILMTSQTGIEKFTKILRYSSALENFVITVFEGLMANNTYNEIIFHLDLLNNLMNSCCISCKNDATSFDIFGSECNFKIKDSNYFPKIVREVEGSKNVKSYSLYEMSIKEIIYPIDLFFLQALHIFDSCDTFNMSNDNKNALRSSSFLFIKSSLECYDHLKTFGAQIKVMKLILAKTVKIIGSIEGNPHTEMTKKNGVQHSQYIIKRLCFLLKALTEWPIVMEMNEYSSDLKSLFFAIVIVYNWVVSESVFLNCFLNFLQLIRHVSESRKCIMQEVNGIPLIKEILKRANAISVKPPHTPSNLGLLKNIVRTLKTFSYLFEVRLMLKNAKVFQILELLHPQIQKKRKTTWNDVVMIWLEFFEFFSCYEDSECSSSQISLLCRFIRIGSPQIKSLSLKIIRNFSLISSIGYVILVSNDFVETVDSVLSESESYTEKLIILQTLLGIISRSEQSISKIKNSSLNRKLKDHLSNIEDMLEIDDNFEAKQVHNLSLMLKNALYN